MKRLLFALIVSLFCVAPALAWEEPDSFRGVPWGASVSEAMEILTKAAEGKPSEKPDCWGGSGGKGPCMVFTRVGPVPATLGLHFSLLPKSDFSQYRFSWALLSFSPSNFTTLQSIFIDRYCQPTSRDEQTVQTRMGAKYVNEVLKWEGTKIYIELSKYGSKIDNGYATLMTAEHRTRTLEEAAKAIKKGKGDL